MKNCKSYGRLTAYVVIWVSVFSVVQNGGNHGEISGLISQWLSRF